MDLLFRQFHAHARARPARAAVAVPGGALSYGELAERANRFAVGLRARGIGSADRVGLCLDWTPDLLASILGTWQAGATYVPLDPALPQARLDAMLAIAQPAGVVAPPHWRRRFEPAAAPVFLPDDLLLSKGEAVAGDEVDAGQAAYAMFTSGTTGEPKGVLVSHASLAGLFAPFRDRFQWQSADVWSLYHSYAFGYSVWEMFGALSTGACLVPVPAALRADPVQLQALLAEQGVTILSQTPSAFRQTLLHEAFSLRELPALRMVALSGEALPASDVAGWFARTTEHRPQLINTYAVTETGGQVTCKVYESAADGESDSVGTPLPGVEVRLLDASGRQVRNGEAGELYVGGPGLALGYLDDEALTRERFVELPAGDGTRRFYRTGDIARVASDGSLAFVGRRDGQLKWHGYRIESAEIEAALQAHPAIREAAVALRGDAEHAKLVAYYVTGARTAMPGEPEFWPAVGPYQVYDEFLYDLMGADDARLDQFRAAFARAAAGRVVLDIGTGEHALLARLCVEAGARHVYAVEVLPAAAARARDTVRRLGLDSRITVIEGDVASTQLPEPVELATQGIIGNIGSADGIIPIWNAARRSFAADCLPVPVRCRTRIAPAELPGTLAESPAFTLLAQEYADRVYEQQGGAFDIRLCVRNFPATGLLAPGLVFEDLDFRGHLSPPSTGRATFVAGRAGRLDGCLLWTEVDSGVGEPVDYFANQQAWLPVFFPLPQGGVPVAAGESIDVAWQRDDAAGLCPDYSVAVRVRGEEHVYDSRYAEQSLNGTAVHRRLHAAAGQSGPSVEALRAWVAGRLPAHMVPATWRRLPALPLNANGKLARDELPDAGHARPALGAAAVPPRDVLESQLAAIWRRALELDEVGVEDDFFALGGDSIAAVRVISMVQRELDTPVGLAALFDAPTVAGLAEALRVERRNGPSVAMEEGVL